MDTLFLQEERINTICHNSIRGECTRIWKLTAATSGPGAGIASPTRGFTFGGSAPGNVNTITFMTIATTGNAQDFGDMTDTGSARTGASSATRGIAFPGSPATNAIDYFTMATTGNAQDFGDLNTSSRYSASSGSSTTRAVVGVMVHLQLIDRLRSNSNYRKCIRLWRFNC